MTGKAEVSDQLNWVRYASSSSGGPFPIYRYRRLRIPLAMLEPDFDSQPTAVQIGYCGYASPCRAPRCAERRAPIVLRKIDAAGRPVRQIELCARHARVVVDRGRAAWRSRTGAIGGRAKITGRRVGAVHTCRSCLTENARRGDEIQPATSQLLNRRHVL